MLNLTNKQTNKYHILISMLTFVIILSIILLPILSAPSPKESPIKTPKEFTTMVNVDSSSISSVTFSSTPISSISSSQLFVISSITEVPKLESKIAEEIKLEIPKPAAQNPIQKVQPQTNIEISAPKPKPIIIPSQPKVVEVIKPPIQEVVVPKIIEQPKVVTSDIFSASGCNLSLASQMLVLVNSHRADNNAKPLSLSSQLGGIACAHSKWMTETGTFSHTGRDGTNPFERCQRAETFCYAENVAYNTIPNVQDLFDQFKTSPGHNINMLDPNFVEIGIAFDGIYVTQIFR